MPESWILVSGSSSGIGRATVLRLLSDGFNVVAGVRRPVDAESLQEAAGVPGPHRGALETAILDVSNVESIEACIRRVRDLTGSAGLRALINNAGIVMPGPVEYLSAADWRRQFDVNFFGAIELTRAGLPLLRQGVLSHGPQRPRLLFISSIGGRVAQPGLAPYTTSKAALTCLGDSMRLELRRQGIGVTVVEPGAIKTDIWAKGDDAGSQFVPDHPARAVYNPEIEGLIQAARRAASRAIPASTAAAQIAAALTAYRAPARVLVGADAKALAFLRQWLPISWFDHVILREFQLTQYPAESPTYSAAQPNPARS